MAPSRKSKSVNKRFTNEASAEIDVGSSNKTKQRKKKLTNKLGPQWTREELERFYDAYRKHPGDWKKVAAAVRSNRSFDNVEALFHINRAYLSLPEGTASVAGLIAMMTDHYSVIGGSESEGEGHDASGVPRKHKKRKRAEVDFREEVIPSQSIASAEGCLLFLRQTQTHANERRATRKRTPRFLVPSTYNMDDIAGSTLPNNRGKKKRDDDDDAHVVALTLADGSRQGGGSPYRRTELSDSTPIRLKKMSQAKETQYKHHDSTMFENGVKIRRRRKGAPDIDDALMNMEGVGTVEIPHKGKNVRVEGNGSDDSGESCNTNEVLRTKLQTRFVDIEASRDEYEVLQVLTEMSASLPRAGLMDCGKHRENRTPNDVQVKSNKLETISTSLHRKRVKKVGLVHAISAAGNRKSKYAKESVDGSAVSIEELGTSRRKRKSKVLGIETSKDYIQNESLCNKDSTEDDNLKTLVKARRASESPAKQLKIAKISEDSSSTKTGQDVLVSATQVSGSVPASLLPKPPNRRKISLKKSLQEVKSSATTNDKLRKYEKISEHELLKEKLSACLSNQLVRRRCIFEWFYSAFDYPWFAKMEFGKYLNHVGLGHVPRLTRLEWSVIKSSLGRPRRFSKKFIKEERNKLNEYRENVRQHYKEVRSGAKEGLPTDIAQPLSVGNRVIAIHPKTGEIRDGKILTVDYNRCNVLFDELGVELVMDTDCMPLNPLEYMPEALRRQIDKCLFLSKEAQPQPQLNRHPNSHVLENFNVSMNPRAKQGDINGHGKVLANNTIDPYITINSKERGSETQRALMLQHTSDAQEMETEMLEIFSGSKSKARAMVDAAMKVASSLKKDEDSRNMVQQPLSSIDEHQPVGNFLVSGITHQNHSNGSFDHRRSQSPTNTGKPMSNGFISHGGLEKQMTSELITSCVATWVMIQMCTEKQYPPADVALLMETAVNGLQPRCPQNTPIYREIQTCMGLIKTQIMALVRT